MIDLHCHSHFSDGILSPEELLSKAEAANLKVLALTDHDTVEGVEVLLRIKTAHSITLVTGIELSTFWKKYDIHIIGLGLDIADPFLGELIKKQVDSRINRAKQISEKLSFIGIRNAFERVCALAGHNRIGRPHFAQLCVDEGKAVDRQAAFKQFLQRGKCAYVKTSWVSMEEGVMAIKKAGGVAVLAHPLKYQLTYTKLNELIKEFKGVGGVGIEVVSGVVTAPQIQAVAGFCNRYDLLASTGSDYHGETLSRISLGRQAKLPLNCMPVWHKWHI